MNPLNVPQGEVGVSHQSRPLGKGAGRNKAESNRQSCTVGGARGEPRISAGEGLFA